MPVTSSYNLSQNNSPTIVRRLPRMRLRSRNVLVSATGFLTCAFALSFAATTASAQTVYPTERPRRALPAQSQPEEVVRIDTDLVSVDVTALDPLGKPVRTLKKEDFKLYEDGVEQPISLFNLERRED